MLEELEGLWELVAKLLTSLSLLCLCMACGKVCRGAEDTEVLLTDSFRFPCAIYTQTLPICPFWIPKHRICSWLGHCVQGHATWQKFQEQVWTAQSTNLSHRWQVTILWKWVVPSPHQDHGFYLPSKRKGVAREGRGGNCRCKRIPPSRGGNCRHKSRLSLTFFLLPHLEISAEVCSPMVS